MPDEAAYAPNWWRILLIDALIGIGIAAIGVVLTITWTPLAWALVLLGGYYEYLVFRRFFRWRSLRDQRRPDPG